MYHAESKTMTQIGGLAVTLMLLLTASLLFQDTAAWACCTRYSQGQLPAHLIQGFSIQTIQANCNINAIIFHTYSGRNVCADPSHPWVTHGIQKLRTRMWALKKQRKQQQKKRS